MKNTETSVKIKEIRNRLGFSQEELAEKSGLSLRTIQRIENGETKPLGDSLKKISNALNVTPDELIDWAIQEDNVFLKILHLSSLTFLFFPLFGVLIPYFMWNSKKNKIKGINTLGAAILNFQLTWNLILFLGIILIAVYIIFFSKNPAIALIFVSSLRFMSYMYTINFLLIIFNSIRISNNKPVWYNTSVKFLKV
ncbi:helix-turn-helix domain-containing protein [Flavivirga abyssicola]|uniref:helix-turn-helix domain-containing protein n=1 Tax=Flavivirga abyssicola TaxID=3063533 RepID=UPI0026DF24CC|nr:helix-turn-helix domain-containing protein [Flavivirga sp. MEBiC07777]WVK12423.1 helix-turn-helix domain-containing protein [Flavivirga sp. MEBiC07777]